MRTEICTVLDPDHPGGALGGPASLAIISDRLVTHVLILVFMPVL
jgi:hypothetical protein